MVTTPLLWDMENMFGAIKAPYQYLKVVGMPSKQMIFPKSLTIGVICRRCVILSYLHPSYHGRVCSSIWKSCLWMITTNLGIPRRFNFIKHWNTLCQINVIKNINIELHFGIKEICIKWMIIGFWYFRVDQNWSRRWSQKNPFWRFFTLNHNWTQTYGLLLLRY